MLCRMNSWLAKFFKNPREIGSVAPSSPALGGLMTGDITPDERVLELGPGDGAITEHILRRIAKPAQLTLIESDEELAKTCQKKFPGIHVKHADVEDVLAKETTTYDVIVSGIPFAVMEEKKRKHVFELIKQRLNPKGRFIMFQYSVTTREELSRVFGGIETKFTPWNVPPAFVFVGKK